MKCNFTTALNSIQFGTITDSRLKGRTGNGCEIVAEKSSFLVANLRTVADLRGNRPHLCVDLIARIENLDVVVWRKNSK